MRDFLDFLVHEFGLRNVYRDLKERFPEWLLCNLAATAIVVLIIDPFNVLK